jgi:hypothetical protein
VTQPETMRLSSIFIGDGLVECPYTNCRKMVDPFVRERVPAISTAMPVIPARVVVACPSCGGNWYVMDR